MSAVGVRYIAAPSMSSRWRLIREPGVVLGALQKGKFKKSRLQFEFGTSMPRMLIRKIRGVNTSGAMSDFCRRSIQSSSSRFITKSILIFDHRTPGESSRDLADVHSGQTMEPTARNNRPIIIQLIGEG